MEKIAVYAGTRNIYDMMYTSLKSLILNNAMDKVYLLIEDNEFPYTLPDNVKPINIADQQWFKKGTANFSSPYSYMALLKVVMSQIFKDKDRILWLDCDTIINDDITDLFSINMKGYYFAGVQEPKKSQGVFEYINVGVLMCNLAEMRSDKKDIEMMNFLNKYQMELPEQDCINILCQGRLRIIDSEYNATLYTRPCIQPKIIHYAAKKRNEIMAHWAYKKYNEILLPIMKGGK